MKNILFNAQHKLRNGWWIVIFIALIALTRFVYGPVKLTITELGLDKLWLEPLAFIFILLVTWICCLFRRESLATVGFKLDGRWAKHFLLGSLFGIVSMTVIVGLIWAVGGVSFELDAQRSISVLMSGLYICLFTSLFEETLHRGFIFQRLINGIGIVGAQLVIAAVFATGHWGNPGMEGSTLIFASLDLALGSVLFGLAYVRTGSLALPIGLHLGWNWMQGNVLGFGVSGIEQAGWLQPVFQGMDQWITGGEFGPEASVFAVLIDLIGIIILWRWKGSSEVTKHQPTMIQQSPQIA
jgi:uncharacterized protein